jgi:tRNA threonylcarbamoyladenosine biosynthesis protein TsaE
VVVREYDAPARVYHVDLYRLERPDEIRELGLDDLLDASGIVIIEWADRAPSLPASAVWIECAPGAAETDRVFTLRIPAAIRERLRDAAGA